MDGFVGYAPGRRDRTARRTGRRGEPRRRQRRRARHGSLETPCMDLVDSDGDDGEIVPSGMDRASWKLVRELQQRDRERERGALFVFGSHQNLKDDLALAQRLQQQEVEMRAPAIMPLDRCQQNALQKVADQARERHDAALPNVRRRIQSLGYKNEDLDACLSYIREEAPVIIHLNETCLSFLAKPEETHYRNLFETNCSGGNLSLANRVQWERNMFGHHYDSASPFQRVKYGCLNLTGDIEGVAVARCYGRLYMSLKSTVRHRCTFFNMDTSAFLGNGNSWLRAGDALATAQCYSHILERYSDAELHSILALGRIGGGRSKCEHYKEVQVHGPVRLATDVEALSVPGRKADASKQLLRMVEQFQRKANCTILWQADLLGLDGDVAGSPAPSGGSGHLAGGSAHGSGAPVRSLISHLSSSGYSSYGATSGGCHSVTVKGAASDGGYSAVAPGTPSVGGPSATAPRVCYTSAIVGGGIYAGAPTASYSSATGAGHPSPTDHRGHSAYFHGGGYPSASGTFAAGHSSSSYGGSYPSITSRGGSHSAGGYGGVGGYPSRPFGGGY